MRLQRDFETNIARLNDMKDQIIIFEKAIDHPDNGKV